MVDGGVGMVVFLEHKGGGQCGWQVVDLGEGWLLLWFETSLRFSGLFSVFGLWTRCRYGGERRVTSFWDCVRWLAVFDGQGAWDAELDLADSENFVMEKVLENMGFVRVNFSDYGRKMVNDVNVEIYGVKFKADFVVLDYVNEGEPSILFRRDFLVTTKSQVDFGLGEIRMNLTKFKEGIDVIDLLEEVRSSSGEVHILTLPEFAVVLGLFIEDEVEHRLFEVYFGKLEVDDKQFDHKDYWTRVSKPTLTNHKEVLVKEPLMRIVHKVIVGSLVHRHASGTIENSVICAGHYVTKIACSLGYCVDEEIKKCLELINCDYWTSKMLADELDMENTCLKKETEMPTQVEEGSREPRQDHGGLNTSNFAYPTYEPPNVPPYSYPYIPYPYPYTYYPNPGNQSNQGGSYGLGGDDYFTSAMPDFGVSTTGNEVGGSSRGARFNDDDDMDE
ncbi:hypothetical protein Tco_1313092 [Tanacetum coccineum]